MNKNLRMDKFNILLNNLKKRYFLTFLCFFTLNIPCYPVWSQVKEFTQKDSNTLKKVEMKGADDQKEEKQSDEDTNTFSFNFDLDYGRFIWRGIPISQGPVLTPSLSFSAYNFELSGDGFFYLNNENFPGILAQNPSQFKFPELDIDLTYNKLKFDNFGLKPAFEVNLYPLGSDPLTGTINLELSYMFSLLKVFTNQSVVVAGFPGIYFCDLGISVEQEIINNFSIESSVKLDIASSQFNNTLLGVNKAAADAIEVGVSATYYLFNYFYLKPHLEFSSLIDSSLRENGFTGFSGFPNGFNGGQGQGNNGTVRPVNNQLFNGRRIIRATNEFAVLNIGISLGIDY